MDISPTPMEILLDRFQSLHPPMLKGTENALECENLLENMDQLFESLEYPDDRTIKLVVHQLLDVAKSWWIMTKKALEGRGTIVTWDIFKSEFYQRFFPTSFRKDRGAEFENLKQGNLNIEEYAAKFSNLLRFAPHVASDEEAKADHFINGLNPDIFTLVNTGRPNTFAEALDRAKGAETGIITQRGSQYSQRPQQPQFRQQFRRGNTGGNGGNIREKFKARGKQFKRHGSNFSSSSGSRWDTMLECVQIVAVIYLRVWDDRDRHLTRIARLLQKGAECLLVYAIDTSRSVPKLADIPIVSEFSDVFPDEIPGFPLVRDIDFNIELMPVARFFSIFRYHQLRVRETDVSKTAFRTRVVFLGHVISSAGISVGPSKVEAVINWCRPTSVPEDSLPLVDFSYNNRYQARIGMSPFEALYGRKCRSPLYWDDLSEAPIVGPDMIRDMTEKVKLIQSRMRAAQDRQAKYVNIRRRSLIF
ncbi:uncharacterized protein [Primulina eburnea]|uniref:uncharacterized protein n=1 Tax=Primulina eburnea TaxID=1245227 RepID=UPI003C6C0494